MNRRTTVIGSLDRKNVVPVRHHLAHTERGGFMAEVVEREEAARFSAAPARHDSLRGLVTPLVGG